MRACIVSEARRDRAGLDQRHEDAGPGELEAERVRPALYRELGGSVGAGEAAGDEPNHGGTVDDAAGALRPHHRNDLAGEIVPADEIRLEKRGEVLPREILDGGGMRV